MADASKKELTLVRTVNASREVVWKAWTDPKLLAEWWGPEGVTNPVCEVDARPGGAMVITMLAGPTLGPMAGQRWPMKATFNEVVPPERLVFAGGPLTAEGGDDLIMEAVMTVTFAEAGGKTIVTVRIAVTKQTPAAAGPLSGMEMGWNQQMDKFARFIDTARSSAGG